MIKGTCTCKSSQAGKGFSFILILPMPSLGQESAFARINSLPNEPRLGLCIAMRCPTSQSGKISIGLLFGLSTAPCCSRRSLCRLWLSSILRRASRYANIWIQLGSQLSRIFMPHENLLSLNFHARALRSQIKVLFYARVRIWGFAYLKAAPYTQFHPRLMQLSISGAWDKQSLDCLMCALTSFSITWIRCKSPKINNCTSWSSEEKSRSWTGHVRIATYHSE